jgi:hypothetical protein
VIDQKGQDEGWQYQKFNPESVVVVVISCLEFDVDQIESCVGRRQEEYLH